MGQKDTLTKNYMENPDVFADFFNGVVYGGEEVLRADMLQEVDSTNIAVIPSEEGKNATAVQKFRDVIKSITIKETEDAAYMVLGIENQSHIHYAMPIRMMVYDALAYSNQASVVRAGINGKLSSAEFLSGFRKEDRIKPLISVTVYWGNDPWDAPTTLKEMFCKVDSRAEKWIQDYSCNLFSIIDAVELPEFKTDLGDLFALLNARDDGDKVYDVLHNRPGFRNVKHDTAMLIQMFTSIELPVNDKEATYDVCKAVEDIKNNSIEEGKKIGIEKGTIIGIEKGEKIGIEKGTKIGIEKGTINSIKALMGNNFTFEKACALLNIPEHNRAYYKSMI